MEAKLNYLFLVLVTFALLRTIKSDDELYLDLNLLTSDELQETFGVSHQNQVPKHYTLIPRPKLRSDGSLNEIHLEIEGKPRTIGQFYSVDDKLFTPDMVTVYRHENGSQLEVGHAPKKCHFHSKSNNSMAAVSTCDGNLKGVIIQSSGVYVLHPVSARHQRRKKRSSDELGLHILYKRDVTASKGDALFTEEGDSFCGLESSFSITEDWANEDLGVFSTREDIAVVGKQLVKESDLIVETAIFVDKLLWDKFYGTYGSRTDSELRDYIATMMNAIQIMYLSKTMTPTLNFRIIRLEVFKTQPYELGGGYHGYGHAQKYLNVFCKYQRKLSTRNWDHAFMLTGYDLHRGRHSTSISGIARLHGMCDEWNSCTVTEGLDFTSVFIGTHELGHSVGMGHDEPYCQSKYIMSQSLGPGKVEWSPCSMKDYHRFIRNLDNNRGRRRRIQNCMRDTRQPKALDFESSTKPGQKYTADQQCALMHGRGYSQVTPRRQTYDGICYMMWCGKSSFGRIITSHPALEGTMCANGKWCLGGKCVIWGGHRPSSVAAPTPSLTKVDGRFSSWSSVACGACRCSSIEESMGVLKSHRTCTNPAPKNGGRDCSGSKTIGVICQKDCSDYTTETAQQYMNRLCTAQRDKRNDREVTGDGLILHKRDERACKIFCTIKNSIQGARNYRYYGDDLPDGTPCGQGQGYCVAGNCLPLSCQSRALSLRGDGCPSTCSTSTLGRVAKDSGWSSWTSWSRCSTTCDQGTSVRNRKCRGGYCPGNRDERRTCNDRRCPKGSWSSWHSWTSCSVTCGSGTHTRDRRCSGSNCSGSSSERRTCNEGYCPWTIWGSCSKRCNGGTHRRTRKCPGGGCSGASYEDERCNEHSCGGTWTSWSQWSSCSATCGGQGWHTRTRRCSGAGCTQSQQSKTERCAFEYCPWQTWNTCSQTCGSGTQKRMRYCPGGGCSDKSNPSLRNSQTKSCSEGSCSSKYTAWSIWGDWTQCSVTCGRGVKGRYRRCIDSSGQLEDSCPGSSQEREDCSAGACADSTAKWNTWSSWSYCSKTCGGFGKKNRRRACIGGSDCSGVSEERHSCGTTAPCPSSSKTRDKGTWSVWSEWNQCSATCGTGRKSRQRKCIKGVCTDNRLETVSCNHVPCGKSHAWGQWGTWSLCSRSCGGGRRTRVRTCFSGSNCPGWPREFESCSPDACGRSNLPPLGTWRNWGSWSDCSQTCGGGVIQRKRDCYGGQKCIGKSYEEKNCKRKPCAEWGGWGHWSTCNRSCGTGTRKRVRNCYGHGDCFGESDDVQNCATSVCS